MGTKSSIAHGRCGFTLIELLVVIAIIAILAAILTPAFISAQNSARVAGCKSNLHQIHVATTMYLDDWYGKMFANISFPGVWGNGSPSYTRQGLRGWAELLYRYHRKVEIYRCPAYYANYCYSLNGQCESRSAPPRPKMTITYFDCPGTGNSKGDSPKCVLSSKGVNDVLSGDSNCSNGNANGSAGGQFEGTCDYDGDYRRLAWMPRGTPEVSYYNTRDQAPKARWLLFPGAHNGANNIVFWDGHVRAVRAWDPSKMTMWLR